jgi:hypothetical protein
MEMFKIRFLIPSVSAGKLAVFRGEHAARESRVDSKNAGNVWLAVCYTFYVNKSLMHLKHYFITWKINIISKANVIRVSRTRRYTYSMTHFIMDRYSNENGSLRLWRPNDFNKRLVLWKVGCYWQRQWLEQVIRVLDEFMNTNNSALCRQCVRPSVSDLKLET